MNSNFYPEAAGEAIERLPGSIRGLTRREAEKAIGEQLEAMKHDGRLTLMTDEEERLVRAFRRFKLNLRRNGEVFKWQTRIDNEAPAMEPVVLATDSGLIRDPQEVSA